MIREVRREDIPACVNIIKQSFRTVADDFGFTEKNAPRFTAFATTEERLLWQMESEHRPMFMRKLVFCADIIPCSCRKTRSVN